MTIKTILVDDEPLARVRMRELLSQHSDISITAEFANGVEAKAALETVSSDLVLLDVQMPRLNGLQLLQTLGEANTPLVVFITAHDSFALEAFDTRAVDYLLKPVRPERLARALDRVREQMKANLEPALPEIQSDMDRQSRPIHRLMAKVGERVVFIHYEQIDWIESAGNYVIVHAGKERYIIRETMGDLERGLPTYRFVRLNRSLIVKVDQIKELNPNGPGEYFAVLAGGRKANVTIGLRELEQRLRYSG